MSRSCRSVPLILLCALLCPTTAPAGDDLEQGWVVSEGLQPLVLGGCVHVDPLEIEEYRAGDEDDDFRGRRVTLRFSTADGAAPDQTAVVELPRGCEELVGRLHDGVAYLLLGARTRYTLLRWKPHAAVETLLEGGMFIGFAAADEVLLLSRDLPCDPAAHGFSRAAVLPLRHDGAPPGGLSESYYQQYLQLDVELEKTLEPLWLAYADSYLVDDSADCSPAAAVDGDIATAWVEGVEGDGTGQSLGLEFILPLEVRNVALLPGRCAAPEVWRAYGRPRRVRLELADGTVVEHELEDAPRTAVIPLDEPHTVNWLTLTVLETYPGEHGADTAISELTINYLTGY